ncbi:MAG: replication protein [Nitrospirae bacterium]|nr:replication protein [Nitrospirota bacterium]
MDKPKYHTPITRNKSNAQQSKGIPAGLMIDEYDSLISPFKMKDEGNYTMFNNDILEALPLRKIRPEASKTYQWLYRKIIGYQKVVDRISLSQIEEGTDLTTRSVTRALKELLQRNMIIKIKIRGNCYYGLTSIEKWTSREKLKLIGKKPIQGDMFANNDKENAIDRIVHIMDTSAEDKRKKLI